MIMILMLCFMLYVDKSSPTDENDTLINVDIYDNFLGTEYLFYGDLTKMDDMFLPPLDSELSDTDDIQDEQELAKRKDAIFKLKDFDYLRPKAMTPDVAEFNDITRMLQNETRRYMGNWRGWADHEDVEAGQLDDMSNLELEYTKKEKMSNMHLQWIVHTRILVQKAFVLRRDDVRTDKRYKIGYLMSRLRIIRYEQQKIASHAAAHEDHYCRNLRALLNYYERMVRYDVDIKDTVNFIKELDKQPIPKIADTSTPPTRR